MRRDCHSWILLAALALAPCARAGQTLVQHPNNFTCNSSTPGNLACTVTLTQSIGAGHVLLMLTASWLKGTTSTASYVSASSGDGSSWTQCPSAYHGSINFSSTQWMDTNCAYVLSSTGGGSATASITLSAPTGATTFFVDAEFLEITPTAGSTAVLETQTTAYTTSSSCSPCVGPALSLAGSDDYVAQWIAQGDATTFSIGGAYTNPIDVDANDVEGAFAGALDQSSAGAQSWTVNTASEGSMSAIAIRTAAGSHYTATTSERVYAADLTTPFAAHTPKAVEAILTSESARGAGAHFAALAERLAPFDAGAGTGHHVPVAAEVLWLFDTGAPFAAHMPKAVEAILTSESARGAGAHFAALAEWLAPVDAAAGIAGRYAAAIELTQLSEAPRTADIQIRRYESWLGGNAFSDFASAVAAHIGSASEQLLIVDLPGASAGRHASSAEYLRLVDVSGGLKNGGVNHYSTATNELVLISDRGTAFAAHGAAAAEAVALRDLMGALSAHVAVARESLSIADLAAGLKNGGFNHYSTTTSEIVLISDRGSAFAAHGATAAELVAARDLMGALSAHTAGTRESLPVADIAAALKNGGFNHYTTTASEIVLVSDRTTPFAAHMPSAVEAVLTSESARGAGAHFAAFAEGLAPIDAAAGVGHHVSVAAEILRALDAAVPHAAHTVTAAEALRLFDTGAPAAAHFGFGVELVVLYDAARGIRIVFLKRGVIVN
jgi:hypothetical protein